MLLASPAEWNIHICAVFTCNCVNRLCRHSTASLMILWGADIFLSALLQQSISDLWLLITTIRSFRSIRHLIFFLLSDHLCLSGTRCLYNVSDWMNQIEPFRFDSLGCSVVSLWSNFRVFFTLRVIYSRRFRLRLFDKPFTVC